MNLQDLTDQELIDKINSMTHIMNQVGCYRIQHETYKELKPVWDEFHRRNYGR